MRARWPTRFARGALVVGALSAIVASGVACGDNGLHTPPPPVDGSCPMDQPPDCPMPAPSYSMQVGPIIQTYCVPCHSPGGIEASLSFASYADITSKTDRPMRMLLQLHSCQMPPPYAEAQPTEAERVALLGWLVCHTPNN